MKTIAAISTPDAPGGIAMIRISGDQAIALADQIFVSVKGTKPSQMRGYSCAYGQIVRNSEPLDDVILTVYRAPHSYTGEDTVEITCHGGIYLTKQILGHLFCIGAEPAGPGEFTKRAFLNGKLSLSQAEAVMDLIRADGEIQLHQAALAKEGALSREMQQISSELVEMLSAIAYWQDDAEEMPPELDHDSILSRLNVLTARLQKLSDTYLNGRVLREGIRTVLLGKPNAGKSSVMNLLCGMSRSIVTDIPGTTRDVITEQVKIGDFTLLLSDTAGIRETDSQIEQIGIQQAYQALDSADLVLYVVDAAAGMSEQDFAAIKKCAGRNVILLWNKMDLTDQQPPEVECKVFQCSAKDPQTMNGLQNLLCEMFASTVSNSQVCVMNERQNALILAAKQILNDAVSQFSCGAELDFLYSDLDLAAEKLRAFDGESVSNDVIDGVFSRFCVGK